MAEIYGIRTIDENGIINSSSLNASGVTFTEDAQMVLDDCGVSSQNLDDAMMDLASLASSASSTSPTVTSLEASKVTLSSATQAVLSEAGITASDVDTAINLLLGGGTFTSIIITTLTQSDNEDSNLYTCEYTLSEVYDYLKNGTLVIFRSYYDTSIEIYFPTTILPNMICFSKITPAYSLSVSDGEIQDSSIQCVAMEMVGAVTTVATDVYKVSLSLLPIDSPTLKTISTPLFLVGNSLVSGSFNFSMGGTLTGLSEPVNDTDAVNKSYVDTIIPSSGALGVETGSYIGTGVSGSSNPNSITFEHTPIMVWIAIHGEEDESPYPVSTNTPWIYGIKSGGVVYSSGTYPCYLTWDENTLSWYYSSSSSGASIQMNGEDHTYNYVAIYINN